MVSLEDTGLNKSVPIAVDKFSSFKIFNSCNLIVSQGLSAKPLSSENFPPIKYDKAARKALASLEGKILNTHLKACVKDSIKGEKDFDSKVEELINVLKR